MIPRERFSIDVPYGFPIGLRENEAVATSIAKKCSFLPTNRVRESPLTCNTKQNTESTPPDYAIRKNAEKEKSTMKVEMETEKNDSKMGHSKRRKIRSREVWAHTGDDFMRASSSITHQPLICVRVEVEVGKCGSREVWK